MTPFESYMFVDDSVRYPMTFVVQFNASGNLDRQKFQTAIDEALKRHPMLRTRVQIAKASRYCWVDTPTYDSTINWGDLDQPIQVDGAGEFIDLKEEIGFRCFIRHNEEQAKMIFVFHHSTCDGIGAYQFLGEALWFYGNLCGAEDQGELPALSEMDLRQRLRANLGTELSRIRSSELPSWDEDLAQPLSSCDQESVTHSANNLFPQFHLKTYDRKQFKALRLAAQEDGQTVNDRMLQSLFVAIHSWNQQFGTEYSDRDITINMPLDLRAAGQPMFSAINLVTSALVRRSGEQIENRDELNCSLREETIRLKHSRHESDFMKKLVSSPLDPELALDGVLDGECQSTCVFSNAGDPTKRFLVEMPRERGKVRAGNMLIDDVLGTPPIRNQTRATISVFTYCRELKVCLRCDPHYFSNVDAERFLQHFVACFEAEPAKAGT